jgi:hypothetical protein
MATVVVFASSLSVASILVTVKALELKFGKRNFFLQLVSKLDSAVVSFLASIKFRSFQLIQSIRYIFLVQIRMLSKEIFLRVQAKIADEYKMSQSAIMGRKDITNRGSVSFYLKKISENRGNGEKGKIEEGL